jgi:hypothetical protein
MDIKREKQPSHEYTYMRQNINMILFHSEIPKMFFSLQNPCEGMNQSMI